MNKGDRYKEHWIKSSLISKSEIFVQQAKMTLILNRRECLLRFMFSFLPLQDQFCLLILTWLRCLFTYCLPRSIFYVKSRFTLYGYSTDFSKQYVVNSCFSYSLQFCCLLFFRSRRHSIIGDIFGLLSAVAYGLFTGINLFLENVMLLIHTLIRYNW